ncbi:MAG: ATP-binding protein [Candidatus Aminicenantes bacterium]|nr:MAG: ATP-binding protein [Candidatus Aminicenantes bacterium]
MLKKETKIKMNTLKVTGDLAEVEKIRTFLRENLQALNLSDKAYYLIELSLLEICINIARYAYPEDKGEISLKIWQQQEKLFFEIRDWGIPFNPRKSRKPDIEEIIRKGKKGGLGIFISRNLMDGFDYKRENKQNVLTMYKRIKIDGAGT